MRIFWVLAWLAPGLLMAQTATEKPSVGLSDLPSADNQAKIPALEGAEPSPDLGTFQPQESPSIPKLRPPEKEADKAKDQDWAAQAMLQKKEDAKKKEQEQMAMEEAKARDSQKTLEKEKKEKEEKAQASKQPAVAAPATPGFAESDAQKLPVVTGLDGVKPRAMASGDGRVQPGFDSFTGPSGTGPLGKDFQSGAKPIMPGGLSADGRMQVPQPPEPPSGGYKRISQDPFSVPPGYGQKTQAAPPPQPKPVVTLSNPPSGDPKRVVDDSKAGFSPYDNSKKVPDPRSQRRF